MTFKCRILATVCATEFFYVARLEEILKPHAGAVQTQIGSFRGCCARDFPRCDEPSCGHSEDDIPMVVIKNTLLVPALQTRAFCVVDRRVQRTGV